jgi:hypothetical protein
MSLTNAQVRPYIASATEIPSEDILGWVVVVVTTGNRVRTISNGNPAQMMDLLRRSADDIEKQFDTTNRE